MGEITASPWAFALLLAYAGVWFVFDRKGFDWHAFATLATLFMTLIIQRAEYRDTQALQAKLDELLRVNDAARNELMNLDQKNPRKSRSNGKRTLGLAISCRVRRERKAMPRKWRPSDRRGGKL
jgi:low affinity Fe/Cu permease